MQTISVTELRTKSPQLIQALKSGQRVKLIYRSRPIADIEPISSQNAKPFDARKFQALLKQFNFPRLTVRQARARYRKHLLEKYGKHLS